MNLVRKCLFALQADWYGSANGTKKLPDSLGGSKEDVGMLYYLIEALGVVLKAPGGFVKEDIKATVAYLAANLHESRSLSLFRMIFPKNADNLLAASGDSSPHSVISRFEFKTPPREKAEQVFSLLVQILGFQPFYTKFTSALPITRIILLLLGDQPPSVVVVQTLNLIGISIRVSSAFSRKFELVSGWNVLRTILPAVWDPEVNRAAFDLLLGRASISLGGGGSQVPTPTSATRREEKERTTSTTVSCTHILPTIISALQTGLIAVANNCHISENDEGQPSVFMPSSFSNPLC